MKSFIAACIIICACVVEIEEGIAQTISCISNGQYTSCFDRTTGRSWITWNYGNGNSTTTVNQPNQGSSVPPANWSECTIALGCLNR